MNRIFRSSLLVCVAAFGLPSVANAGNGHGHGGHHGHHGGHHGHHSFHHAGHHFGHGFGGHHSGIHLSFGLGNLYGYRYPSRFYYGSYPSYAYSYPRYATSSLYYSRPTYRYYSPISTYRVPSCSTRSYRIVSPLSQPAQSVETEPQVLEAQPTEERPEVAPPPAPVPPQPSDADEAVVRPNTLFTGLNADATASQDAASHLRYSNPTSQAHKSKPEPRAVDFGVSTPKSRPLLSDNEIPWVAE